ncbi:hypothetical protein ACHAWU_003521 [Discostella pseudostelligera]|uniref:Proteasome endopeptidase complex n=1 Tax=Discostella pseudostelligera TaxID=259834 RepID=A0ABD3M3Z9_9STRA
MKTAAMPTLSAHHLLLPILFFTIVDNLRVAWAQQSSAGQDTLIGIVGRDFVMMGADSSTSSGGGIALTSSNIDKIAVIHDGNACLTAKDRGWFDFSRESMEQQAVAAGFAGDVGDADRLIGLLKTHAQIMEYEAGIGNDVECVFDGQLGSTSAENIFGPVSTAGLDAESIANLARSEIASRMRSRQPLQLCLLVGGMIRCSNPEGASTDSNIVNRVLKQISSASAAYNSHSEHGESNEIEQARTMLDRSDRDRHVSTLNEDDGKSSNPFLIPRLFWLDQYGSLQSMRYAAHGFGSNFAYSVLDQRFRNDMTRHEAVELLRECFEQLRLRYIINSPRPPRIKCIDRFGVVEVIDNKLRH